MNNVSSVPCPPRHEYMPSGAPSSADKRSGCFDCLTSIPLDIREILHALASVSVAIMNSQLHRRDTVRCAQEMYGDVPPGGLDVRRDTAEPSAAKRNRRGRNLRVIPNNDSKIPHTVAFFSFIILDTLPHLVRSIQRTNHTPWTASRALGIILARRSPSSSSTLIPVQHLHS